jgi:hypothetical protein
VQPRQHGSARTHHAGTRGRERMSFSAGSCKASGYRSRSKTSREISRLRKRDPEAPSFDDGRKHRRYATMHMIDRLPFASVPRLDASRGDCSSESVHAEASVLALTVCGTHWASAPEVQRRQAAARTLRDRSPSHCMTREARRSQHVRRITRPGAATGSGSMRGMSPANTRTDTSSGE